MNAELMEAKSENNIQIEKKKTILKERPCDLMY